MTSDEEVASLWTASSLEWSTLGVASEDLGEFLSGHVSGDMLEYNMRVDRDLAFTLGFLCPSPTPHSPLPLALLLILTSLSHRHTLTHALTYTHTHSLTHTHTHTHRV